LFLLRDFGQLQVHSAGEIQAYAAWGWDDFDGTSEGLCGQQTHHRDRLDHGGAFCVPGCIDKDCGDEGVVAAVLYIPPGTSSLIS
jgi:hypothetical protein